MWNNFFFFSFLLPPPPFYSPPGVGQNLQDHLEVYVQQKCTKPITLYNAQKPVNMVRIGLEWLWKFTGMKHSMQSFYHWLSYNYYILLSMNFKVWEASYIIFFIFLKITGACKWTWTIFFFSKSAYFETVIISWVTRAGFIHCFLTFLYLISKKILHLKISVLLRKNEEEILFEIEIMSTKTLLNWIKFSV